MILSKLQKNPARMTSVGLAFITIGLSFITIGLAWPRTSPPIPPGGTDWNDFFRGASFGIATVFEIVGIFIAAKAAALKRNKAP